MSRVLARLIVLSLLAVFWQPTGAMWVDGRNSQPGLTSINQVIGTAATQPQITAPAELRARQQVPLATCGFISGDPSRAVTCGASYYCAVTSTFVGCCTSDDCRNVYTSCYDRLSPVCDQSCQQDPQNLICPSSKPYCALFNYPSGSIGLGCEAYSGLTETVLLTIASAPSTLTTPSISSSSSKSTASSVTSTRSHGLSGGSIAGIVIGVVAGIVLSAIAAWFAIKRVKRTKITTGPEIADTPGTMRESSVTELSDNSIQRQWQQSNSTPDRSGRTSYQVQSTYVPDHYGREFTSTPGELPDTSRPLSVPSTEATANTTRS